MNESEINLRGTALIISTAIEHYLMNIIYFSKEDQYKEKINLRSLMFKKKIEMAADLLENFHSDLWKSYSDLFDKLKEFKDFRNRIAHCMITWVDDSEFEIWDVDEIDKFQFLSPIRTNVSAASFKIIKASQEILPPLESLLKQIETRFQTNYPYVYGLLKQG